MLKKAAALGLALSLIAAPMFANEGAVPRGVPHLDHVFVKGDTTVERLVQGIMASPVWHDGRNAIVIVWDENDYSGIAAALPPNTLFPAMNQNQVVLTVQTNDSRQGVQSDRFYDSFSLLKSMESGFGLPCLNHACDSSVHVMSDLFGAGHDE